MDMDINWDVYVHVEKLHSYRFTLNKLKLGLCILDVSCKRIANATSLDNYSNSIPNYNIAGN